MSSLAIVGVAVSAQIFKGNIRTCCKQNNWSKGIISERRLHLQSQEDMKIVNVNDKKNSEK